MTLEEAQKVVCGDTLFVGEELYMMPLDHHFSYRQYTPLGHVTKIINTDNDIDFHVQIISEYGSSGVLLLNHKYCITGNQILDWQFEKWFNTYCIKQIDIINVSPKELIKKAYMAGLISGRMENND
jgi:hypothetical protein